MHSVIWKKSIKSLLITIILLTLVGLIDSLYLSSREHSGAVITCGISSAGCNDVLTSPYAIFFGILPLAYAGVMFYAGMILLTLLVLFQRHGIWIKLLTLGSLTGFIMSGYFVYIQLYEIYTICPYCMLSAINSTLIFTLSVIIYFKQKTPVLLATEN